MVLELETSELFPENDLSSLLYEVHYRSSPPTIPSFHSDIDAFTKSFDLMLSTKALPWSYEEEVRIKLPSKDGVIESDPIFLPFSETGIKRVILGIRDDEKLNVHREVPTILTKPQYRHVKIQWAVMHPRESKLCFADQPSQPAM